MKMGVFATHLIFRSQEKRRKINFSDVGKCWQRSSQAVLLLPKSDQLCNISCSYHTLMLYLLLLPHFDIVWHIMLFPHMCVTYAIVTTFWILMLCNTSCSYELPYTCVTKYNVWRVLLLSTYIFFNHYEKCVVLLKQRVRVLSSRLPTVAKWMSLMQNKCPAPPEKSHHITGNW